MLRRLTLALAAVAALLLMTAAAADARDRNNDRIPDRWEKRHDLSLKVKQTKQDQDRDGMKNLAEFRAKMDPRDDDSDDDGIGDEDENAGKVVSFTAGELTIALFAGGEVPASWRRDRDRVRRRPCGNGDGEHGDGEHGGDEHGDDDDGDDEPATTLARPTTRTRPRTTTAPARARRRADAAGTAATERAHARRTREGRASSPPTARSRTRSSCADQRRPGGR